MDSDKQLRCLKISDDLDEVYVKFEETRVHELPDGADESADNDVTQHVYEVTSQNRPHKNLTDALKKLRKHGMAIKGIELADASKQIKNWVVRQITIDGDSLKQQSRMEITLGVRSDLTGKVSPLKCGSVTMYPKDDEKVKYSKASEMVKDYEDVVAEVWEYLNGKTESDDVPNPQLALFPKVTVEI